MGERWSVSVTAESQTSDAQGGDQLSSYLSRYDVEVLAVEGDAPSRVRLHFTKNAQAYQYAEKPTVLDGRTFVVHAKAPLVTDESGTVALAEETERVLDVFPDLGTRARVDEVLPDDAMQLGDRRDDLAAAVLRVIHPRAWTLTSGTASLASVEDGDAKFSITLDASSQNGVHMEVSGGAWVHLADARLVRLELDGTYEHGAGTTGAFTLRRLVSRRS